MKKFQKIDSEFFSLNAIQPDQMRYIHGGAMTSAASSGKGSHHIDCTDGNGGASTVDLAWDSDDSSTGEHTGSTCTTSANDAGMTVPDGGGTGTIGPISSNPVATSPGNPGNPTPPPIDPNPVTIGG